MTLPRRDVAAQVNAGSLDLGLVPVDQGHQVVGVDAGEAGEEGLHPVEGVVVAPEDDVGIVLVRLHEQTRETPRRGRQTSVLRPRRDGALGAPHLTDRGVDRGNVGIRTRAVGEHRDRRVRQQVVRQTRVQRRRDGAGALTRDHELRGVGELCRQGLQRSRGIDRALVLHGELGAVLVRGIADVHVTRAVRSEHERVVGERIARIGEVEDPGGEVVGVVLRGDVGLVGATVERAGSRVEARSAALEEEDNLVGVGSMDPVAVRAAVGTHAFGGRRDLFPSGDGRGIGGRRRAGRGRRGVGRGDRGR